MTLKIAFKYWPREPKREDHFFLNTIMEHFDAELSNKPDYVFFSGFDGKGEMKMPLLEGNFTKIFWTGENIRADLDRCDYAFAYEYEEEHHNDSRYMRFPLYAYYGVGNNLTEKKDSSKLFASKTGFCNYIYSKDAPERVKFFKELSKYKKIDAPGRSQNNHPPIVPKKLRHILKPIRTIEAATKKNSVSSFISRHSSDWRGDVIDFQSKYKFSFAFENASYPGYTTEKIYHAMLAKTIPIYWGNPKINRDFNEKSFVNYHKYNDAKKVIDIIIDLDRNDKKYKKMLAQPWFKDNKPNKWCDQERVLKQLERIFGEKRNA